uniref:CRISPR-associated protein Cas5 n=1 Tax=Prevotella sp. GTC17260 TaxID=3236796 RepID=A0AB33J9K6_9BACT
MKSFQFIIEGNWGHFRKTETNNNPLSHDLITKTALIGMIGAVLGIERRSMKNKFPVLSDNLMYGVRLLSPVRKVSWGFTSKKGHAPTSGGSPKYFEFLKSPKFLVILALKDEMSSEDFDLFCSAVKEESAVYTPVLGWHNCPASLSFVSEGILDNEPQEGVFETYGFAVAEDVIPQDYIGDFRIGFDKIPTYQDDDFWNFPDRYCNIIYPDFPNSIKLKGKYYEYYSNGKTEKWCLV